LHNGTHCEPNAVTDKEPHKFARVVTNSVPNVPPAVPSSTFLTILRGFGGMRWFPRRKFVRRDILLRKSPKQVRLPRDLPTVLHSGTHCEPYVVTVKKPDRVAYDAANIVTNDFSNVVPYTGSVQGC